MRKFERKLKHRHKGAINVLDLVPFRTRRWVRRRNDGNVVSIVMPRFRSSLGKKFGRLLKISPIYYINLDRYGSHVWRLCDGTRTVREIGDALKEKFPGEVEPVYERVAAYLSILERGSLIRYNTSARHGFMKRGSGGVRVSEGALRSRKRKLRVLRIHNI